MTRVLDAVQAVLARARASSDIVLAVVMAMIIGALIVPLPEVLLDVGLAINLAASAALLVAALYARDALKVAAFPTLLLVTTLFRLAMNVSSTRLALSEGHAGEIIAAFGEFVVRGDYVVGAVIFAILTLVQFLVVTKGAERVAEVSARFTLDAMPGKQMSIDADLRAGAITQDQARARRRALERESQLFGSMDGAMKFVKGDVIAGLVITLINLVAGPSSASPRAGWGWARRRPPMRSSASATGWCRRFRRCASRSLRAWWSPGWPASAKTIRWAPTSARSSSASTAPSSWSPGCAWRWG